MPALDADKRHIQFFTLLEILAAMAILSILTIGLYEVQSGIQHIWQRTEKSMDVRQNVQIAFNLIESDLKGMVAKNFVDEKILVDANGIGEPDLAFVTNSLKNTSSDSTLFEVGYSVDSHRLLRWQTADSDGAKWDFLNTTPEVWAEQSSWGSVNTVINGVSDFEIRFYKITNDPPQQVLYDASSDSDVVPTFAVIKLSLIHPQATSEAHQNSDSEVYTNMVTIKSF